MESTAISDTAKTTSFSNCKLCVVEMFKERKKRGLDVTFLVGSVIEGGKGENSGVVPCCYINNNTDGEMATKAKELVVGDKFLATKCHCGAKNQSETESEEWSDEESVSSEELSDKKNAIPSDTENEKDKEKDDSNKSDDYDSDDACFGK
ncbi:uncharacterized protein [Antedon mediterranea]|uniref:uncharacterized protein n=1 Tax=Antedon mediterranea TaxID=105859 RepID=UPI003AF58698